MLLPRYTTNNILFQYPNSTPPKKTITLNSNIIIVPLSDVSIGKWIELCTFNSTKYNLSGFTLIFGHIIYNIRFGSTPDGDYLSRCTGVDVIQNVITNKVAFKVIDNILHIYVKFEYAVTSGNCLVCLGYYTENDKCTFTGTETSLSDSNMDKMS